MLSKNQIKSISALHLKKNRNARQLFIVEGIKLINELLASEIPLEHLYTTLHDFEEISPSQKTTITNADLQKISALTTANTCLAVFKILEQKKINTKGLVVVLEEIRDPGNLGTIIRLCDWFGVVQIVCSPKTVDLYNPKVVQATMGSIARVAVNYMDIKEFLATTNLPVFGTFMEGETIYKTCLPTAGIVVFGNEANGISEEIEKLIAHKISIPRFGETQKTESLNVATATAIVLSEFKRSS